MSKVDITKGYKKTKLGWIPEEWKCEILSNCGEVSSGGTPSTDNENNWEGEINWYTPTEVTKLNGCGYIGPSERKITQRGLNSCTARLLPVNSIIVCTRATIGIAAILTQPGCTNQGFKNIVVDNKTSYNKFLYYYIISQKARLLSLACGSTFLELPATDFRKFPVPLPPLPEQKKIAEILSTWDEAIDKLNTLIEKKKLLKKGLMQQLLTGKKRLPGYVEPWKMVHMHDVFDEIKDNNDGDGHSIMTISSKYGLLSQKDKFNKIIAGDSLGNYTQIRGGDFAYNKGNSKSYEMGCIYQLEDHNSALVPFVYICFRPTKSICSGFYKYWFLNHGLDRQLKRIITSGARGDGLLNVSKQDFFSLRVPLPTLNEQSIIAEFFEDLDIELNILVEIVACVKSQKKGLMQQLLTGKTRVKVN